MTATINASTSAGVVTTADTSGILQLQTNGTAALTVDASQNVGVGTASPAYKLDVQTAAGRFQVQDLGGSSLRLMNSTSGGNIGIDSAGGITLFFSNGTERARLNSTGAFVLAGGTTTADGIGITFPATQSASTNANTLDDYEKGTWTPADGSGASLSLTTTFARYTKIGNQVSVTAQVAYPSTASTAPASISGLPFTNITPNQPGTTLSTNAGAQKAIVRNTFISVYPLNSTTDSTNATLSSSTIYVSAIYLI